MAPDEKSSSIADASKPNPGRIYDYVLGGHHNFEVDRLAAQQILKVFPQYPEIAKVTRWFLGESIRRLAKEGYAHFIDFASGLPTMDHVHEVAPAGTKVIYSDWDAVTVSYGQETIKGNPNVRYVECDAGKADRLLKSPVVQELFGNNRKVVFGFNGISWFLTDEQIRHSLSALYDWAEKGSKLYLSTFDSSSLTPDMQALAGLFGKFGQPVFLRTQDKVEEIIRPWKVLDPGFLSVEEWLDLEPSVADKTRTLLGGFEKGVFLGK